MYNKNDTLAYLLPVKIENNEDPVKVKRKRILNFLLRSTYTTIIVMWIIVFATKLFEILTTP